MRRRSGPDPQAFHRTEPADADGEQLGDDSQGRQAAASGRTAVNERRRVSRCRRSACLNRRGAQARAAWSVRWLPPSARLLVLLPLAFTVWRAVSFGLVDAAELVFRPLVGELLVNTLMITVSATLAAAVLGTAAAWFVERTRLPGRRFWAVAMAAPLAMPPFITSYAWVSFSLDLQDFNGALLVITSAYFPLVYLPVAAALRSMDPALEESARSLGCGRWNVLSRDPAATAPRSARRHAAGRARRDVRIRRVHAAAFSYLHDRDLRRIPHQFRRPRRIAAGLSADPDVSRRARIRIPRTRGGAL
jgi:hypothetical protein